MMQTLRTDTAYAEAKYAPAIEALRADLALIEEKVVTGVTVSDMIRLGSSVTTQAYSFGENFRACALGAGTVGCHAMGYHL